MYPAGLLLGKDADRLIREAAQRNLGLAATTQWTATHALKVGEVHSVRPVFKPAGVPTRKSVCQLIGTSRAAI